MSNQEWLSKYRTNKEAIWIRIKLTDGRQFYHDQYSGWKEIKRICEKEGVFIEEMKMSFKSHMVDIDIEGAEAVYFIRAAMGQIGSPTKDYYTTGGLKNGVVYKKMWLIPELVIEKELEDDLSECFEQAFIYNEKKKPNRKKQVQT